MGEVGTVYAIRHNPTGRIYVGSTGDLESRISTHMSKLRNNQHPCEAMQRDFNAHGDDYSVAILYQSELGKTDLTQIEHDFMEILNTRNPDIGYNGNDPSKPFEKGGLSWREITSQGRVKTNSREFPKQMRSWLQKARAERGMTQADVAKRLGISESYYAFIESGQRQKKMEITLAVQLSGIFGIPIKRIVELESAPEENVEAKTDDA